MTEVTFERLEKMMDKTTLALKMGKVKKVIGLIIHAVGLKVFIGEVCDILIGEDNKISAEVVGFQTASSPAVRGSVSVSSQARVSVRVHCLV